MSASEEAEKIIDELLDDPEKALEQSALEQTIENLEAMAAADPRHAWDEIELDDGTFKSVQLPPNKWPDGLAMAVESITPNAHGVGVRLVAKGRILEALAKIKGAFEEAEQELTPIERMLEEIPRPDLVKLVEHLQFMANTKEL